MYVGKCIKKPLQKDILVKLIRTAFNKVEIKTTMYCEHSVQRYVLTKQDIREESSLFGQSAVYFGV